MNRLLALLLAAAPALATATESPRWGSFEARIVPWKPNIDAEFHGAASPYRDIFGGGNKIMMRGDVSWSAYIDPRYGTLDLGVGSGYVQARGRGLLPESLGGGPSGDATALRIIPIALSATWRFDQIPTLTRWAPFAPYLRFSLERYNWWVTKGSGSVTDANGIHGSGATNGYSLAAGLALQLDVIDPQLARDADNDTGINHTYLYAEASRTRINDFGSSKSWDLSPSASVLWGFGLLFVF